MAQAIFLLQHAHTNRKDTRERPNHTGSYLTSMEKYTPHLFPIHLLANRCKYVLCLLFFKVLHLEWFKTAKVTFKFPQSYLTAPLQLYKPK